MDNAPKQKQQRPSGWKAPARTPETEFVPIDWTVIYDDAIPADAGKPPRTSDVKRSPETLRIQEEQVKTRMAHIWVDIDLWDLLRQGGDAEQVKAHLQRVHHVYPTSVPVGAEWLKCGPDSQGRDWIFEQIKDGFYPPEFRCAPGLRDAALSLVKAYFDRTESRTMRHFVGTLNLSPEEIAVLTTIFRQVLDDLIWSGKNRDIPEDVLLDRTPEWPLRQMEVALRMEYYVEMAIKHPTLTATELAVRFGDRAPGGKVSTTVEDAGRARRLANLRNNAGLTIEAGPNEPKYTQNINRPKSP